MGCKSLKKMVITNGVESIGMAAFMNSGMTSVVIPNSVKSIGAKAFANCIGLYSVTSLINTPFKLDPSVFQYYNSDYDPNSIYYGATLYVPRGRKSFYSMVDGWKTFLKKEENDMKFKVTYIIDGEEYKVYELQPGEVVTPEPDPVRVGYEFNGWEGIPWVMPAEDVVVNGSFSVHSYNLTYKVEGEVYKSISVSYGSKITPEPMPEKEGYSFIWDNLPETMPSNDLVVKGAYHINQYLVTFIADGIVVAESKYDYGSEIKIPESPSKEGYTFYGWSDVPETVPAHDVTVTAVFKVNQYKVTFIIDGQVVSEQMMDYGTTIVAPEVSTPEGKSFSGWNQAVTTVPAHDVTFVGSFITNGYKVTYFVDGEEYNSVMVEYGNTITPPSAPEKEGYTFSGWSEIPESMPAHDVTVTGTFIVNKYKVRYYVGEQLIAEDEVEYGAEVVLRGYTPDDAFRYTFTGWEGEVYATMPAHDIEYHANIVDGIVDLSGMANNVEAIYDTNGRKLSKPQRGVNILLMRDGSKRKLVVKWRSRGAAWRL